jgi:RHS repeat-associated protein
VTFGGGPTDDYNGVYYYMYNYNQAGRVTNQFMGVGVYSTEFPYQYTNDTWLSFCAAYQWDSEGRMTSLQYPTVLSPGNGHMPLNMPIAASQYDVNGRLSGMTMDDRDGNGPRPFASATYTAAGQLYQLSYGGMTETRTYNSLMQLISQSVPGYLNMTYSYSTTGQNNGRITGSVDGITGESTTYTYDALNRLTAASNSMWSQTYGYDGFGNLTSKAGQGGSPNAAPSMSATYNANNQQVGVSYDANGNQGDSGSGIYSGNTYSMENQLIWQVEGGDPYPANVYAYDPWGKRVLSGSDPDPLYAPQPNYTYTFYGITGQALASANCSGYPNPSSCWVTGQNVYYGRKLIVSGGVSVVTDRLGSVRANTQGASFAYYPYGEERTSTVNGLDKFATYFRDAVGQDYADQRYYNASVGRFWSPDPTMDNVDYTNSASWNAYAYVNGDPINFNDPNGLSVVTLPPVVPGGNCSTAFINYAGSIGMTIQQLFGSTWAFSAL